MTSASLSNETSVFAPSALLPEGWAEDVLFDLSSEGDIDAVHRGVASSAIPPGVQRCKGPVVPGMPNLHSHAFQRAMAGLAERSGPSDDSFWTWRQVMYGFVGSLTPDQAGAIAGQLYVEMLKAGYTAVGEFHYLHHGPDGLPYDDLAEMSRQVMGAAKRTGLGITHLPVLYGFGGFGGQTAGEGQRRFLNDPDRFLKLLEILFADAAGDPQAAIGIAPHSLRAVTPETLQAAVEGLAGFNPQAPIHIHISEQIKEVEDCLAWSGRRPVDWLYDNIDVDRRWCLIHATHMTEEETGRLASSGAVAGICPTTEANLGDGLFPARDFLAQNGTWGIGSDSHISISPVEELRWFEYGQRLAHRRRNLLGSEGEDQSVGAGLYRSALAGGAQALGRKIGRLEGGCRADLVVLDAEAPCLLGKNGDVLLDAMVFAGNVNPVRDVMVGGQWLVQEGRHRDEEALLLAFRSALEL
ncbi:formimidoylglutamate deiminase [Pelagibius sp. Alg239-R121]|uniref:formimidoylglutamate deiminase n=1 Tax=Pelagibius sp. Alg239-R121 TaxID=2993448 RepID=UPI0024A77ACD|nr:formimidoylglutamate deiminase [Pelagibius sp. Alg239-R121]